MLQPETYKSQSALAQYCRSGQLQPIGCVNKMNVQQYRRLVYIVVDDMLQTAFPITFGFLKDEEWTALVHHFFKHHPCQSPQVWYMPKEFYAYYSRSAHRVIKRYPFLPDLLLFEWLEVELFMMEDKPAHYRIEGTLEKDALVLNPEHHVQHFRFPVHEKKPAQITLADKSDYFLVLHRHPHEGTVHFTGISAAIVRLLELVAEQPLSATMALRKVCTEFQLPMNDETKKHLFAFFQNAISTKLILGYTKRKGNEKE